MGATITLSAFLRESGASLRQVEREDLLLERRDGPDVMLKLAERERAEHEGLTASARLIGLLLHREDTREAVLGSVVQALPWSAFLPEEAREELAEEFIATIAAAASIDNFSPVATLLAQWKNTAEVWADPALRERLEAQLDDAGVVPRPAGVE